MLSAALPGAEDLGRLHAVTAIAAVDEAGDHALAANGRKVRTPVIAEVKLLRPARTAGLVMPPRHADQAERPVWVAPALQAFSGDFLRFFCQYNRVSGLFT